MCPLPLAHKAPQRLPGPPKHLSVTLVVTRYSQNNSGLQLIPIVQYIDLHLRSIAEFFVTSGISSGTPNNLRYIKMHKLIITVIVTLSVRTLRFENNVDMTEARLRSITNSGTWMPILAPTYSTKISSDEPRCRGFDQSRIQFPLSIGMLLARDSIVGIQYLVPSRYRQVSLLVL